MRFIAIEFWASVGQAASHSHDVWVWFCELQVFSSQAASSQPCGAAVAFGCSASMAPSGFPWRNDDRTAPEAHLEQLAQRGSDRREQSAVGSSTWARLKLPPLALVPVTHKRCAVLYRAEQAKDAGSGLFSPQRGGLGSLLVVVVAVVVDALHHGERWSRFADWTQW
jgi:hypothetical protein